MKKRKKISKSIINKRFRRRLKSKEKRKNKRRSLQKDVAPTPNFEIKPKKNITKVKHQIKEIPNYEQKTKQFTDKKIINANDVFNYIGDINSEEYDATFQFYQENLERQSRYNIKNCIYYFDKENSFNAAAIKKKNHNLVKINKGLMVGMMNMFKNNPDLLNHPDLSKYSEIEDVLDVPNHILMYQNASHFVFYHELAHLIQFNDLKQNALQEALINTDNFNFSKHISEMDADEFAGVSMASHISQYFEKYKDEEGAGRLLNNLVVLVVSSIILYILSFPSNRAPIYYKQGTHPHPVIRVLSVAFTIISHLKELLSKHNIEINLDHVEIFKEALKVSQVIETEQWGSTLCNLFYENVENSLEDIWNYITELHKARKDSKVTAIYKRNKVTKKIHKK